MYVDDNLGQKGKINSNVKTLILDKFIFILSLSD